MNWRCLTLVSCGALALAALPCTEFPIVWRLTLTAPAAGLAIALSQDIGSPRTTFAAAAVIQVLGVLFAAGSVPLSTIASLGCTLIPPLAYAAARARTVDTTRAVFLSFCLIVVASILGQPDSLLILGWLCLGLLALLVDVEARARERRASFHTRSPGALARAADLLRLSVGAIAACLLLMQSLTWLPSPGTAATTPTNASGQRPGQVPSQRIVGPSRNFEFGSQAGSPLALRSSELLAVSSLDNQPAPSDLYLRSGAFEVAGIDRWRPLRGNRQLARGRYRLGIEHPTAPRRVVAIDCLEATDLAFVPTGAFLLEDVSELLVDRRRAVVAHTTPRVGNAIVAHFQTLHQFPLDDARAQAQSALLELPEEISRWRALFTPLLEDVRVREARSPIEIADAISEAIRERCSYVLAEPTGPYEHSLLNFLDGSRTGFCMHFASTAAIALRMLGVPCRIGVGVYGGEPSPNEPQTRIFGAQHAHAWVELSIAGAGFVVHDPTPPSIREFLRWPDLADLEPDAPPDSAEVDSLTKQSPVDFVQRIDPRWLLAALALVGLMPLFRRRSSSVGAVTSPPITAEGHRAESMMREVLVEAARAGEARSRSVPLEIWAATAADASSKLIPAVLAFQEVRFGGRPLDAERKGRLRDARDHMRALQRQRSMTNSDAEDAAGSSRNETLSTRENRDPE
ncbi:MAG: transglutaminase family protein [Planctomycetota bacterium]